MKIYLIAVLGLLAYSSIAFCQVDTMRLLEVGSVTAPGTITNWYFEDLNGDSIKEIILTTANSVNIYSGQSFSPIWSQSGFTNPTDLNFTDINNDGLVDISVKDTSHIYLIDPHHSTTIWTSPLLDSLYKCYTIGDRNGDGLVDVIIAKQEIFTRINNSSNMDTVWAKIWNGNDYSAEEQFTLLYNVYGNNVLSPTRKEAIKKITVASITNNGQSYPYIFCYSIISINNASSGGFSGGLYRVNGVNLDNSYITDIGKMEYQGSIVYSDSQFQYLFGAKEQWYNSGWSYVYRYLTCLSANTVFTTTLSYSGGNMGWSYRRHDIIEDMCENPGPEWASQNYSLTIVNLLTQDTLYSSPPPGDWIMGFTMFPGFCYRINTSDLNGKYLINMASWDFRYYAFKLDINRYWIAINTDVILSGSIDLLNNNQDRLYSIQGSSLFFHIIVQNVDIRNPDIAPNSFFLAPNYPNPFNASTMIEYGLPESGPVKVDIFDILGRKIQMLVDETQSAGYHQAVWKADDVPSGTYFYRIQSGEKSQTKKCLLLK